MDERVKIQKQVKDENARKMPYYKKMFVKKD